MAVLTTACADGDKNQELKHFSGIYPHLAMYNEEGECGTGAVVPWAGKLWTLTYGPHLPFGSSDKLYEIAPDLSRQIYDGSIGGTPANRMIHRESQQLFIGPYAIDSAGNIRSISYEKMPGRHTGNARHLNDPENKIYYGTMEEGFYEVDVHSLEPKWLYADGNLKEHQTKGVAMADLIGWHGKGMYSGQGVLVYSNNGEYGEAAQKFFDAPSGSLHEWDGKEWKMIRRNQFTEVTGPGGIYGNEHPETDPIWTVGWDHKSLLLGVRQSGSWHFYRLPKASHSYDGAHGWNTEWPRIRNIGTEEQPDYMMTMHGMFWRFPGEFSPENSAGIRPRSSYLKVVGDFARWHDQLVFGCDDSAEREFLNKRKAKGNIEGPGQSNSNLWFTSLDQPDQLGPVTADGAVWQREDVKAGETSDPFLFAGWENRSCWLKNEGKDPLTLSVEVDQRGDGMFDEMMQIGLRAGEVKLLTFSKSDQGEWLRLRVDRDGKLSAHFTYGDGEQQQKETASLFNGISRKDEFKGGLLYGLGDNRRALGMVAQEYKEGAFTKVGYYELDGNMNLVRKADDSTEQFIESKFAIPQQVVTIDASSVLVEDDKGRRWRLPLGDSAFTQLTNNGALRICREVATERDLFNCHGTFYELPAENADGYAKIRPVSSHQLRINDYASYRGMLILTGIDKENSIEGNEDHIIFSDDGEAALWAGAIDDLWKLGKPHGKGGPWKDSQVKKNQPSDPYLIGFYDRKSLELSHDGAEQVTFRMEVDPGGEGNWLVYQSFQVKPSEKVNFSFPEGFQARWIRFTSDRDCRATAWLNYD